MVVWSNLFADNNLPQSLKLKTNKKSKYISRIKRTNKELIKQNAHKNKGISQPKQKATASKQTEKN
jgi:hypothetical protein